MCDRSDKLFLARPDAIDKSGQENMTSRRLVENFSDLASGLHFPNAIKRPLDGSYEEEGCKTADVEKVHIMAVSVSATRWRRRTAALILSSCRHKPARRCRRA